MTQAAEKVCDVYGHDQAISVCGTKLIQAFSIWKF